MSKYYVPKLEDFYTGLKYEYYDEILNEWVSQEFTENRIIREIDLALKSSEETTEEFLSRAYKNNLGKLVECKNIKTVDWLKNVKYRVKMSDYYKFKKEDLEEFNFNVEIEGDKLYATKILRTRKVYLILKTSSNILSLNVAGKRWYNKDLHLYLGKVETKKDLKRIFELTINHRNE